MIQNKRQKPENVGADTHDVNTLTGDTMDEDLGNILDDDSDTGSDIDLSYYAELCKQPSHGTCGQVFVGTFVRILLAYLVCVCYQT